MRLVLGFVTNSSSSSFVISAKGLTIDFDKDTLEKYPIISTMKTIIETLLSPNTTITSIDELNEYAKELYWWKDVDFSKIENVEYREEKGIEDYEYEEYSLFKKELELGNSVYEIEVDYNDETRYESIEKLCKTPGFKMVKERG